MPTLSDGRVRVRAQREGDLGAYLDAFARDDELLNLLGYEDVPEVEWIRRWVPQNWVDPPELRQFDEFGLWSLLVEERLDGPAG